MILPSSLNGNTQLMQRHSQSNRENGDNLGVAATANPHATRAAIDILRQGGNAIDAAVAAAWALAVCEPSNSGLGGQTIMLLRRRSHMEPSLDPEFVTSVFEGHSRAPAAVSTSTVSRPEQRVGFKSTTIPTTPLVLETVQQRFGRLSMETVLSPAIRLAEEGFDVTPLFQRQIGWCLTSLRNSTSANQLFLNNGQPLDVGCTFRQPQLASTLRRLVQNGTTDFYTGHIARQITQDMEQNGGLLSLSDLKNVSPPIERETIATDYRGRTVLTAPQPAGGLQLVLALDLLQRNDLATCDLTEWYERLGEATHSVFREREEAALQNRNMSLDSCLLHSAHFVQAGATRSPVVALDRNWPSTEEPGETTHLFTADADGNVVSLTQSIQSLFGSRAVCAPCGFLYNNYLTTCPRGNHPYQLAAGCQPRSNAAPTIVFPKAVQAPNRLINASPESLIALGAAGSRRTTSALLHVISGIIDRNCTLAESVDLPRFHVKLSRNAWLERATDTEPLISRLTDRFRSVQMRSRHSYGMGCVQAIQVDKHGKMNGTADPRREGTAETASE